MTSRIYFAFLDPLVSGLFTQPTTTIVTVVCGGCEGGDLLGPGAVPRADLHQDRVVVQEAGVLQARTVVVQQRHRVLVLEAQIDMESKARMMQVSMKHRVSNLLEKLDGLNRVVCADCLILLGMTRLCRGRFWKEITQCQIKLWLQADETSCTMNRYVLRLVPTLKFQSRMSSRLTWRRCERNSEIWRTVVRRLNDALYAW